ncbi:probable protein phosphatase 2C 55 isoform X2 [Asparagus officinalis]|uniref:probable protein phosphatase 2C 55 isoform X2 n=1 Tax=Asparagus officinalis TaxID=4686 RepID=UPI00098E2C39|nr:probable protein phosphatase 2C 55 isoform X2 [Asparagus officinalis]
MAGDKERDKRNLAVVRRKWHSLKDRVHHSIVTIPSKKQLKITMGSHYIPRGKKLGDDAHFLCTKEQVIGIADGVGDWVKHGVDAGQYARELMDHSETVVQEKKRTFFNPATIIKKAYARTSAMGSSTACIIALNGQFIHAAIVGDSGFLVVMKVAVKAGDVIVAGTDGLFDNVFEDEVSRIVQSAVASHSGPHELAAVLANVALDYSNSTTGETPYSIASQEAGRDHIGGKPDDITVVIMYICSSDA